MLSLTGHSPIGALELHIGLGAGYYYFPDARMDGADSLALEVASGWSYTAFMSDSFLLRLYGEFTDPEAKLAAGELGRLRDVGIMVGYYIDGIDVLVRDLF